MANVDREEQSIETFGTYGPGFWTKLLIEGSRRMSYSAFFKPASSLCRKLALNFFIKGPVDYKFFNAFVRFQPLGNLAEKRCLLKPAAFDPVEFNFIQASLPEGGTFLDVGANVGLYSLAAAGVLGKNGRVIAFEPNPLVYKRLLCNVALNAGRDDMAAITPLELAVSDRNGYLQFSLSEKNLGEGRLAESGDGNFEVQGSTLWDAMVKESVSKINILKIDIEGHEINALRPFFASAPESLHPDFIIIERGDDEHWGQLAALCQKSDYQEFKACHMNVILKKVIRKSLFST